MVTYYGLCFQKEKVIYLLKEVVRTQTMKEYKDFSPWELKFLIDTVLVSV